MLSKLDRLTRNFNPRPPWGGRQPRRLRPRPGVYFNPRPPWGGRLSRGICCVTLAGFQSTPSVGRATEIAEKCPPMHIISIHALRGEGDCPPLCLLCAYRQFQSTPSVGRATILSLRTLILLLRFQSTPSVGRATAPKHYSAKEEKNFNPRPPWGGRLQKYTNMQCYACT